MARRSTAKLAPARLAHFLTVGHRQRVLAGAALIACAAALAYFPALRGGFILDDNILLTDNGLIKAPDGWYRIWCTTEPIDYWPVFNTAFWLQWRLWGLHPTGYHVVNLILHIITGLLIWIILHRLSIPGAFVAALLFAVHPVNVETVAWISQCKGLLAMLFFLLSILSYLQAEEPAQRDRGVSVDRWYWLSLVAFALAMLSKGSVAILPAVLLGIVWWLRPLTRRDLLRTLPFVLIAVVLVRVNVWFQTHGTEGHIRSAGVMERLVGAGAVVWFYLSKALVPVDLAFIYPQWHVQVNQVWWWLPLLAAVAVTCLGLLLHRARASVGLYGHNLHGTLAGSGSLSAPRAGRAACIGGSGPGNLAKAATRVGPLASECCGARRRQRTRSGNVAAK
jgi:hypothetical protein